MPQSINNKEHEDFREPLNDEAPTSKELSAPAANRQTIKKHLGIDSPKAAIIEQIKTALDAAPRGAMFGHNGLCSGYSLKAMPDRYFLAQAFTPNRADLRQALTVALAEFGMQPITADDMYWQGHILCKISAFIQGTPFGMYQLTVNQNRNVYLELGIAMGLNRPFVLVKDKDAELPSLALGLEYYPINSYLELRYELGEKLSPFLLDVVHYLTPKLPKSELQRTVVIAHGDLDVLDFCILITKALAEYRLTPVILGDPTGKLAHYLKQEGIEAKIIGGAGRTLLDETVAAIQTAILGVYRIDKSSQPDAFIALGLAIGLNRLGLLVHRLGDEPPSDLKGLSVLDFRAYTDLKQSFPERFGHLLQRYS